MAIIKKSTKYKCLSRCGKKETLLHYWEENKLGQPLWRTVWWFLKKTKIDHMILDIHPEKMKTLIWKDTCTPVFTAALFTTARWMDKKDVVYTHTHTHTHIDIMEYYSAIKKNEMPFVATRMDLEIIILGEVNQTKTNIIWYHLYVDYKKMTQMSWFTKQITDSLTEKTNLWLPEGKAV